MTHIGRGKILSKLNLTSLQKRLISAVILGPAALAAVFFGDPYFFILTAVFAVGALYEFYKLLPNKLYFAGSITYTIIAFGSFYLIRETFGMSFVIAFMILIWSSDVGAFFVGKIIGGSKLYQKISPNKTWSGFIGALVTPMILYAWFGYGYAASSGEYLIILFFAFIGVAVGASGQAGDLSISYLKRRVGVKDTGDLIPGHGGVLDRLDSMMLAAPVFLGLMVLFQL